MDKEVKFIGVASMIFKVLAWISAAFFLIVSVIVLLGAGGDTPRIAGLVFLIGGGIYFLVLFTISVSLKLLATISESSQDQAESAKILNTKVDKLLSLLEGKPSA